MAVGGRPEACVLDCETRKLALRGGAVGAIMAGSNLLIDLDRGGPVVLEVNAVPGWRAFEGDRDRHRRAALDHLRGVTR